MSFLSKVSSNSRLNPFFQAAIAFGLIVVFASFAKLLQILGVLPPTFKIIWVVSASFLLLFSIGNGLVFLTAKSTAIYWSRSIMSYASLLIVSALLAWLLTSVSIGDAASFKWIYFVLTIGYLVILSIVGFMKIIVELAQKKDTRDFSNRRHKH